MLIMERYYLIVERQRMVRLILNPKHPSTKQILFGKQDTKCGAIIILIHFIELDFP